MEFKPNIGQAVEPSQMTIQEAINYKGRSWQQLTVTARNWRRAGPYIAGAAVASLFVYPFVGHLANWSISGCDNKGGQELKMYSNFSNDDMDYTREFQRMMYLNQPLLKKAQRPIETEEYLKLKGVALPPTEAKIVTKKSPHHKYF